MVTWCNDMIQYKRVRYPEKYKRPVRKVGTLPREITILSQVHPLYPSLRHSIISKLFSLCRGDTTSASIVRMRSISLLSLCVIRPSSMLLGLLAVGACNVSRGVCFTLGPIVLRVRESQKDCLQFGPLHLQRSTHFREFLFILLSLLACTLTLLVGFGGAGCCFLESNLRCLLERVHWHVLL